jgi:DNA ligase (NAD+)
MIRMVIDAGYDKIEKIMDCSVEDFSNIKGFCSVKAKNLYNGLRANEKIIFELLDLGIKVKGKENKMGSGKLNGMKICITGSTQIKRKDLQKMISDNGGENSGSANKSTTHLIITDVNSDSKKAISARDLGIKLISEDDFLAMIE